MKGIVFNLLEQVVTGEYGEDTWDALLRDAKLEGAYTSVGSYPDKDLFALVAAASEALGVPPNEVVRWFGRKSMPLLSDLYPEVFEGHPSTISFILQLNDVIHPQVRKLFPGAYVPDFDFEQLGSDELMLGYSSKRRLCRFAEGLIEGASVHFGEKVIVEHRQCQDQGDDRCVLMCRFSRNGG